MTKFAVESNRVVAFLSSRQDELSEYRDAAFRGLTEYDQFVDVWRFEDHPSATRSPEEIYLKGVDQSDVIIFIAGSEASEATAAEVVAANGSHKDILCFILPSDNRAPLVSELIERVRDVATTVNASSALGEFELQVSEAIRVWILQRVAQEVLPQRLSKLEVLQRESYGRIAIRLVASGLDEGLSESIATDIFAAASGEFVPSAASPMIILVGPAGAGKSVMLERAHQFSIAAAEASVLAPVPIYLKAADVRTPLRVHIEEACRPLGDLFLTGAAVAIDGLDELTEARANEIYDEAALLCRSFQHCRITLASRHQPPDHHAHCAMPVNPLTDAELSELVSKICGRQMELRQILHDLPMSVQEAVHRPLFAIAFAQTKRDGEAVPGSIPELVEHLIARGLGRSERAKTASADLKSLAAAVLDSVEGTIPVAHVGADKQEALLATRLVHEKDGKFEFPLRIVAEYAASHFLEGHSMEEAASKADDPAVLDRWHDALAMYLSRLDDKSALAFVNLLAEIDPGRAFEFARDDGRVRGVPWTGDELGQALLAAMGAFSRSIPRLVPTTQSGGLPNVLAAFDERGWVYTGWRDRDGDPQITTTPPKSIFEVNWEHQHAGRASDLRFFANLRAQDDIKRRIAYLLENRAFLVEFAALKSERIWASALTMVGRGEFNHEPIPLDDIELALASHPENTIYTYKGGRSVYIDAAELRAAVKDLRGAGAQNLRPPFVPHDQATSGWVWSGYSPDAILRRRTAILQAAMGLYELIVDTWFGDLRKRLQRRLMMPAIIHERIDFTQDGEPVGSRYWEPLRKDASNDVDVQFGPAYDFRTLAPELSQTIAAQRPEYAGRLWAGMSDGIIRMWGIHPIRDTAYRWLDDDLRAIGWSSILGLRHDEA